MKLDIWQTYPTKLESLSTYIWDSIQTCDNYGQLEETIRGLNFACITRTCGLGMIYFIIDDC